MVSPTLTAALEYASAGCAVNPLCHPTAGGICGCGWGHEAKEAGKAPRTTNGVKDASSDPSALKAMWRTCTQSNVGIALEASGLTMAGPDSREWLAEFQHRGLPDTAWAHSVGGEGHRHYHYRRPEGCPAWRINKPGEYDIQTAGYAVAPLSIHHSLRQYTGVRQP